jgi:rhodanese-related sulfurtransferase
MACCDAMAKSDAGEITLIDVREAAELSASGKAQGAHHVPLGLVDVKLHPHASDLPAGLSKDTPIACYCAKGGRAQQAASQLLEMGYTQVYNIGGFEDWCAAGGKSES